MSEQTKKCHKIGLNLQNSGAKIQILYIHSRKIMLRCSCVYEINILGMEVCTEVVLEEAFLIMQNKKQLSILIPASYMQKKTNLMIELYSFYFLFTLFISRWHNKRICIRKSLQDNKETGSKYSKKTLFSLVRERIKRILITLISASINLNRGQKWN
jgi:hypothetical protein